MEIVLIITFESARGDYGWIPEKNTTLNDLMVRLTLLLILQLVLTPLFSFRLLSINETEYMLGIAIRQRMLRSNWMG